MTSHKVMREILDSMGSDPMTFAEISNKVNKSYGTLFAQLKDMIDLGLIEKKTIEELGLKKRAKKGAALKYVYMRRM